MDTCCDRCRGFQALPIVYATYQGNMPGKYTLEPTGIKFTDLEYSKSVTYTWVTGRWVPGTRVLGTDAIIIRVIVDIHYIVYL